MISQRWYIYITLRLKSCAIFFFILSVTYASVSYEKFIGGELFLEGGLLLQRLQYAQISYICSFTQGISDDFFSVIILLFYNSTEQVYWTCFSATCL